MLIPQRLAKRDLSHSRHAVLPQHPVYQTWAPIWQKLLDVYEGAGGLLDDQKPYLAAHPREWLDHSIKDEQGRTVVNPSPTQPSPKLRTRRKLARYENIAATLLDQLRAALFRKAPNRSFLDPEKIDDTHPLRQFWTNADGQGRAIDPVMQESWMVAAVFGHMLFLADRDGETPEGLTPSQADAPGVIVRLYTPLDMPDWLVDESGRLTAVKFLEAASRPTFDDVQTAQGYQVRTIDADGWKVEAVQTNRGTKATAQVTQDAHGFGTLPVVPLYARRRALTPFVGRSVLGDPNLYVDHYNLISEVRELLRAQTFAILNVPIGERTGGAQTEMELIGQAHGTGNILFSTNAAAFISPQDSNVAAYHEHIDRLIRTIYRLAVVGWESDSREVESAESRKLKKEDLHQMLASYASECEQTERQLAQLVYRAHYGDRWQQQWETDKPSIVYPDDFDLESLAQLLEHATAAIALELGETATKELKKKVANELLNGATQPTLQKVQTEIEALEVKTEQEKQAELLEMRFAAPPEAA